VALQNRVTPHGEIVAAPAQGLFMGNRGGRIHDPSTRTLLNRKWASKRWICCVTAFKNRQRQIMGRSYTELFFLDEVTALAAGHRPCFECRRAAARAFASAWQRAFGLAAPPMADDMDRVLHRERVVSGEATRPMVETAGLPDGAMVVALENIYAVHDGSLLRWSLDGYADRDKRALVPEAKLLTPPAIVAVLNAGYAPEWHPSSED
jgi:hypothetical protein